MVLLLFILACVLLLVFIGREIAKKYLQKKVFLLCTEIERILNVPESETNDESQQKGSANIYSSIDMPISFSELIENKFDGIIIAASQKVFFRDKYAHCYERAKVLSKLLELLRLDEVESLTLFIYGFESIDQIVERHNEHVISLVLETHKEFFDHCLQYPLDSQQRRSIVSEEDNCLVVSSAGSGKTSSIVGKVKYLTEIKGISPEKILLISYTHKAATELTERISTPGLKGYTFHKLALDIIGRTTGEKPSICDNTDALIVKIYKELCEISTFRKSVIEYFADYASTESEWERKKDERRENLSDQKMSLFKAQFPDMDGRAVYVRSEQERRICFVLSSLGVRYRYEEDYEYSLADETHSQYRPDFSIYYEKDGRLNRVYLEHFGVDEHGYVSESFADNSGLTYDEANKKYNDSITWKKDIHNKYGTKLIETSSADFHYTDIRAKLIELLTGAGVPIDKKTDSELFEMLLPKSSKQEKVFVRFVATFVALTKSSCQPLSKTLGMAKSADDDRSIFVIDNIMQPIYWRYEEILKANNQIDFTDAIIKATELCSKGSYTDRYDYIIVDEFQDISVDRYKFLKALRDSNPPAKLYCVGDDWQSIYRFSGSDMALFNKFADYFGVTEINRIETTYRFGQPLIAKSSQFIERNENQIKKNVRPFNESAVTELEFVSYERIRYCDTIGQIVQQIPSDKSILLLGRYSFDDYYLSYMYKSIRRGGRFYYVIGGREIEFLTVHKSKGLEADYAILLQCNKDVYGFPALFNDNPVIDYLLTKGDGYPYGEERRLFYVAITRAKVKTVVLYDRRFPSVFVDEFLNPEKITDSSYMNHPNANKRWSKAQDRFLLTLAREGKSLKYMSMKMGRSQTSIKMRLDKLGVRI